jgi:hypothetical protein
MDTILWQIPAGIGAIVGLVLAGLGRDVFEGRPTILEIFATSAATLVTYSLLVAEYKNHVFQVSRNIYIKSLHRALLDCSAYPTGYLIKAKLEIDDFKMEDLPGLPAAATRDLIGENSMWNSIVRSAGPVWLGSRAARLPAFKTLFAVSVFAFAGEVLLVAILVARAIIIH